MLVSERQLKIIELIKKNGSVQVEKLAQQLNVSKMTIRRDLEKLDEVGMVERCHGGAVAKTEVTYAVKQISNRKEKELLAEKCLEYISEGSTIYLDAGTTVYAIAKLIRNMKDVMVVTTDLEIAQLLKDGSVELIICGGYVQKSTGSVMGYYATTMMEDFRFDVGFFGASFVDENFQVLTPTMDKAFLKRQIVAQCQQSFLVVDDSKFKKQAMTRINQFSDYTGVITNYEFSKSEIALLDKMDARIISV